MNTVIFDLDGTISDPAEGITRSINYALAELGYKTHPEKDLYQYIGPHLQITFSELTGVTDDSTLMRAIELFRERYIAIGYKENLLYDGIIDVLSNLISSGATLCIATTKRKDIAEKVLKFLEIDDCFSHVLGCDLHRQKSDLLREILLEPSLGSRPTIMIGDRDTDFISATEVAMPSIAVSWGYGNREEFALATAVAENLQDLPELISKNARLVRPQLHQ